MFVTHVHFGHYSQVIYGWEDQADSITYLLGREAGTNPEPYYFDEWRESTSVGGMDVYTIYSHHRDIPEVAYLAVVGDLVIYRNGDSKADYENDFEYLRMITDRIDVAFAIGHPFADHQRFQQACLMDELFDVAYVFPMNREGEPYHCQAYAELLDAHSVTATVVVVETRGAAFVLEL